MQNIRPGNKPGLSSGAAEQGEGEDQSSKYMSDRSCDEPGAHHPTSCSSGCWAQGVGQWREGVKGAVSERLAQQGPSYSPAPVKLWS